MNKKWGHPNEEVTRCDEVWLENLKQREKEISEATELESLNVRGDFGSYKVMLQTEDIEGSQIEAHHNINPAYRVVIIKGILGEFSPREIIDVGCGLGFTTSVIKRLFPTSEVTGIDLSTDAIAYGEKHFVDCKFVAEAIDPSNTEKQYSADLICAFEFYPFTRTSQIEDHKNYLNYLMGWLNDGGRLVILQLWDNEESLSANYDELVNDFSEWQFMSYLMPFRRIGAIVQNRILAVLMSQLLRPILRALTGRKIGRNKIIIIKRV